MFRVVQRSAGILRGRFDCNILKPKTSSAVGRYNQEKLIEQLLPASGVVVVQRCHYHSSQTGGEKLDEFFPEVVDFPGRHIGPRKHESRAMLKDLGYNVSYALL